MILKKDKISLFIFLEYDYIIYSVRAVISREICSCLFLLLLDTMSRSGKESYEVFITSAVCSALAEHTHMEMQIGGTYARGSNAENNRSCN